MLRQLICLILFWPVIASAQAIQVDELQSAAPFQAGTLDQGLGGLDPALWQNTNAVQAIRLLENLPAQKHPLARDILRSVILSPGVPPEANNPQTAADFQRARIGTALALGALGDVQTIVERMPRLSADQRLSADLALLAGNHDGACQISDSIIDGRSTSDWLSLRAFCHIIRGEIPAAELTLDLLKSEGFDDPAYFNLMRHLSGAPGTPKLGGVSSKPLHVALMSRAALDWPSGTRPFASYARDAMTDSLSPEKRMAALFGAGEALSDAQMTQVLEALAETDAQENLAGGSIYDFEHAMAMKPSASFGQLYNVARFGNSLDQPQAISEILKRAEKAGAFDRFVRFLSPQLDVLPSEAQIALDLPLYLRVAVTRKDIAALQQLYGLMGDERSGMKARIALAADAIGNGFYGGNLGSDIETRLNGDGATQKRAMRDALIAFALGANMSDTAMWAFEQEAVKRSRMPSALMGLKAATRKGARAESLLWTATLLSEGTENLDDYALYQVIDALQSAGLFEPAGQIAAHDFLMSSTR